MRNGMEQLPGQDRLRHVSAELKLNARQLRRGMTPAEEKLWVAIRNRQIDGLKFRRQHAVGTFVLDFYCAFLQLVLEVDGTIHDAPDVQERDRLRQQHIEAFGIRVLRFRNEQVMNDLPHVLNQIRNCAVDTPRQEP